MLIHGNGKELPKEIDPKNNICLVVSHLDGSKDWWYGSNKVTDDGDIYYAKRASSENPSSMENFGASVCVLQNPASADTINKDDTYGDVIYDVGQTSPVSATKILTHWNFTSPATFHKTSTDTLKLFVNHTFNGV